MPSPTTHDSPAEPPAALEEIAADASSRKRFMKMMGAGGAGALAVFLAASGSSKKTSSTSSTATSTQASGSQSGDVKIVNYALTLEYLESDFYTKVIASGLFKGKQLDLIKTIGEHEREHVAALEAAVKKLGGAPAAKPKTKFPLKDAMSVVKLAATVENLGASAYLGQASKIQSKEILAAALSIHSVEARHASALNSLLGKDVTPDGAFAVPASMAEVLPKVKPFIVA
jgi:rubrerythrin